MQHQLKKLVLWLILPAVAMLTTGCSIKTRNLQDMPPQLRQMQLQFPDTVNINFSNALQKQFAAFGVKWLSKATKNTNVLEVNSFHITYSDSNNLVSNSPSTYTFTANLTYQISRDGKIILGPNTLSASTAMIAGPETIYSGGASIAIRNKVQGSIITLLYNQLTAPQTKATLR